MEPNTLLTTREAADYLTIHESTMRQWRRLGIGPAYVKVGPKRVRYQFSDLTSYVLKQTVDVA
jgi:excisionase family DNA binding protein